MNSPFMYTTVLRPTAGNQYERSYIDREHHQPIEYDPPAVIT